MSSPPYPSMISIVPSTDGPSVMDLGDRESSMSDGLSDHAEAAESADENMFDNLANDTKIKPTAPSMTPEPERASQLSMRSSSPERSPQRSPQRSPKRVRQRRSRPLVDRRSRRQTSIRQARHARQARVERSRSRSKSIAKSNGVMKPVETRMHKIVRIESNLVALHLELPNLEDMSMRQLDALDEKLKAQSSRDNILKLMRQGMIMFCVLVEKAHTEFNAPNKHLLEGWSGQVFQSACKCEYDHHLLAIYDYYSPGAVLHPVLSFVCALGGSAVMFVVTRYFMDNGLEAMRSFVTTPNFAGDVRQSFARPSESSARTATPVAPVIPDALVAPSAIGNPMIDAIGSVMRNPGGLQPMLDGIMGMMGGSQFTQPTSIGSAMTRDSQTVPVQMGSMSPPPPPPQTNILQDLQLEEDIHFTRPEAQPDQTPAATEPDEPMESGVLTIAL